MKDRQSRGGAHEITFTLADFSGPDDWEKLGGTSSRAVYRESMDDCVVKQFDLRMPAGREQFDYEQRVLNRRDLRSVLSPLAGCFAPGPIIGRFVVPFYKRGNLTTWIEERRGSSDLHVQALVRDRFKEVFQAVQLLHRHNISHGNLKAASVLQDDDGRVILCGFKLGGSQKEDVKALGAMLECTLSGESSTRHKPGSGWDLHGILASREPPSVDEVLMHPYVNKK